MGNEKNCRFRGKLENHPRARASVVGCIGDDITFVNINLDGEFKVLRLTKDGKTWTKIPNPNIDTMVKVRGKRDTYLDQDLSIFWKQLKRHLLYWLLERDLLPRRSLFHTPLDMICL